jgi:hypothetical protein
LMPRNRTTRTVVHLRKYHLPPLPVARNNGHVIVATCRRSFVMDIINLTKRMTLKILELIIKR